MGGALTTGSRSRSPASPTAVVMFPLGFMTPQCVLPATTTTTIAAAAVAAAAVAATTSSFSLSYPTFTPSCPSSLANATANNTATTSTTAAATTTTSSNNNNTAAADATTTRATALTALALATYARAARASAAVPRPVTLPIASSAGGQKS